jgi:hypothetical protein
MCGSEDCKRCFPYAKRGPDADDLRYALQDVIDIIMNEGIWPSEPHCKEFDLYDFLLEKRDPSYMTELYVEAMSSTKLMSFKERIVKERKAVEELLRLELEDSDIVREYAKGMLDENA